MARLAQLLLWLLMGILAVFAVVFSLYRNGVLRRIARDWGGEERYVVLERSLLGGPGWGRPSIERPLPAVSLAGLGRDAANTPTASVPLAVPSTGANFEATPQAVASGAAAPVVSSTPETTAPTQDTEDASKEVARVQAGGALALQSKGVSLSKVAVPLRAAISVPTRSPTKVASPSPPFKPMAAAIAKSSPATNSPTTATETATKSKPDAAPKEAAVQDSNPLKAAIRSAVVGAAK